MIASACVRSRWKSSRSAGSESGAVTPSKAARPSALATMFTARTSRPASPATASTLSTSPGCGCSRRNLISCARERGDRLGQLVGAADRGEHERGDARLGELLKALVLLVAAAEDEDLADEVVGHELQRAGAVAVVPGG